MMGSEKCIVAERTAEDAGVNEIRGCARQVPHRAPFPMLDGYTLFGRLRSASRISSAVRGFEKWTA